MQGIVKGGRRQGKQKKRWEDNIREWTDLEFAESQRAVENIEKIEREKKKTGCEIICCAQTTLAVKEQMIMVMMIMMMMIMMMMPVAPIIVLKEL